MINIQTTLFMAMPRVQGLKALLMWLDQSTGCEYSWNRDENISPAALLKAIDDLELLLPVLKNVVRFIDNPDVNKLLTELSALRLHNDELHDACVELSGINSSVERQNALLLAENSRLQHCKKSNAPIGYPKR